MRSPTPATTATGPCRRCRPRCGRRPPPATSTRTNDSTGTDFVPGRYPVGPRIHAALAETGDLLMKQLTDHRCRPAPATRRRHGSTTDDTPHEECGVFGISTPHGDGVAQLTFFGLFALQHRGQEAAGIAVSDGSRVRLHKDAGLVANVFTPDDAGAAHRLPLDRPHPLLAPPASNAERNIQPFLVETMHGPLALAHNGNLVNAPALRDELLNPRLRAHRDERHRGDDADARRRRGPDLGGPHRAHAAGVEGRVLARHARRRPGDRGPRPVGVPAVVGRSPSARRLCGGQRDVRARHARLRRHQRGAARARSSRCSGAEIDRRQALTPRGTPARCTFEFVYFSRPDSVWAGPQHAPRPPAARRGTRPRVTGRRRRRDPRARLARSPRPSAISRASGIPLQRRADQEPLHRPHVHRADAGPARPRRGAEVQRPAPRTSPASGS